MQISLVVEASQSESITLPYTVGGRMDSMFLKQVIVLSERHPQLFVQLLTRLRACVVCRNLS